MFTLLNILASTLPLAFLTGTWQCRGSTGPSSGIGPGPLLDALMTVWCLMHARTRLALLIGLQTHMGSVAINVLDLLDGALSGRWG